ncbi:MAG: hypothetical protein KC800_29800, partial [Candidatus Eremiobacteraeota bacterium]|nr:hypothetical protein [Candidatus Eremiobacteraeota bacterium]
QTSRETRFGFDCPANWTLDEVESAFFTPEPGADRAMNHLVSALWTVGVGKRRGFLLTLPGFSEGLLWDGAVMHRLLLEEPIGCSLIVSHRPSDHSVKDWLLHPGLASRLNAEVSTALAERCYTCPVPLYLDRRRLDGFHLCPSHGWMGDSFPFYLDFLEMAARVRIPPGTFDNLQVSNKREALSPGLHVMSVNALQSLKKRTEAGGVLLVSAHASKATSRRYSKWETRRCPSVCYWIRDGVVVDSNIINAPNKACSVALFLDADDLQSDISGLAVAADAAKAERMVTAARQVKAHLQEVSAVGFQAVVAEAGKQSKFAGGAFLLVGTGILFVSPLHGFACMGAGVFTIHSSGKEEKELVATYRDELAELVNSWPDKTAVRTGRYDGLTL